MSKRGLIVLLTVVNLVLLATLILSSWRLPAAYGQAVPLGQQYLVVAAEIKDGVDALYVLDVSLRRLHAFVPNRDHNDRRLFHAGSRDLLRDFRGTR